jgi:hypothetical protein
MDANNIMELAAAGTSTPAEPSNRRDANNRRELAAGN